MVGHGRGKYDALCTLVREQAQATAMLVIIHDGNKGHGFSVQAPPGYVAELPTFLRNLADAIEEVARGQ